MDVQLLGSVESVLGVVNRVAGAAASTKRQAEESVGKLIDEIGIPTLKKVVKRAADEALGRVFSDDSTEEEINWQLEFVLVLQEHLAADPQLGPLYTQLNVSAPADVTVLLEESSARLLIDLFLAARTEADDIEQVARLISRHLESDSGSPGQPVDSGSGTSPVVIRPGESLWSIAEAALGGQPSVDRVDAYWRRIYRNNREGVGDNPDLIHPGLPLDLPPPE